MLRVAALIVVALLFSGAPLAYAENAAFKQFELSLQIHGEQLEKVYGVPLLDRAVDLRDGKVGIHVTSAWQCASRDEQEANALDLFALWRAAEADRHSVMITIIGPDGEKILSVEDATGQPIVGWRETQICSLFLERDRI